MVWNIYTIRWSTLSYYVSRARSNVTPRWAKGEKKKWKRNKMKKIRRRETTERQLPRGEWEQESTINTRPTIGGMEAFASWRQLIKALADWFRLLPSRPAPPVLLLPTKQCLTAANFCNVHLGKTPFALKWSNRAVLLASLVGISFLLRATIQRPDLVAAIQSDRNARASL